MRYGAVFFCALLSTTWPVAIRSQQSPATIESNDRVAVPFFEAKEGTRPGRAIDARLEEWPGFAALRFRSSADNIEQFTCGGTAIAPLWIVTAAHCITTYGVEKNGESKYADSKNRLLEIVLGVVNLDNIKSSENVFEPAEIIVNPGFDKKKRASEQVGNDIALIKLERGWQGLAAKPGMLPTVEDISTFVQAAGFGASYLGESQQQFTRPADAARYWVHSKKLRWAQFPSIGLSRCKEAYPGQVGAAQICAGMIWGREDTCTGDSGGPLFTIDSTLELRYVGLVSWGLGCAEPRQYGVYTRLSSHKDWLEQHIGKKLQFDTVAASPLSEQKRKLLGQLDESLQGSPYRLQIDLPDPLNWRVGEVVSFRLESPIDGRLILIDIDPEGKVTQIFPNRFSASSYDIKKNTTIWFPDPAVHGFDGFRLNGLPGEGEYIGLVVPAEFPFEKLVNHPQLMAEAKATAAGRLEISADEASSYLFYLVTQVQKTKQVYPATIWAYGRVRYRQQ